MEHWESLFDDCEIPREMQGALMRFRRGRRFRGRRYRRR